MDEGTIRKIFKEELKEQFDPIKKDISDIKDMMVDLEAKNSTRHTEIRGCLKNIDENIGAVKEIIGRHEVDITVLKRRPV